MTFALADLASVVGSGDRVSQRCERRQEHRTFELFVSSARGVFAADGRSRSASYRCESSVRGQVACRSERATRHIDQESRSGPDPDSWHAGQDRMKRVCENEALDFLRHFVALTSQRCQLLSQARQDDGSGLRSKHHHSLLRECLSDLSRPASAHARCEFDEAVTQLFLTESCELGGRRMSFDQIEHGGMIQMRPHDTLERGMYLCQQTSDAVASLGDLTSQVIVEAAQHRELCDFVISQLKRTQRMRHAACRFRNDVCISRIRLGFTRVQIGDPTHRKSRRIGDCNAFSPRHGNRQSAYGRRLVDNEKHAAMLFEFGDERSKFGSIVRQSTIEQALSSEIERDCVMCSWYWISVIITPL